MEKSRDDYNKIKESYEDRCNFMIESRFESVANLIIYDFNYYEKELIIGFRYGSDYGKITFSKRNGDLYISKSESYWDKDVFAVLNVELSELYDDFINFSSRKNEVRFGLRAVNSNFLVDISFYGVDIFVESSTNLYKKDFNLSSNSSSGTYIYDCNSSVVINACQGRENEIFERIFVKISDCPKWSQPILYKIRQNQLAEEQRVADEQRYREMKQQNREMKKQKILEFKRKIFPFLKK